MTRKNKNTRHLSVSLKITGSVGLAAALMATSALAQTVPTSVNPAKLEQRFDRKGPALPASRLETPAQDNSQIPDKMQQQLAKKRFVLKNVVIEGSTVYSQDSLKSSYAGMLGKEISLLDAQKIAKAITDKYRGDQFVLSQAIIPPQEIKDGTLKIRVVEGYINDVIIEGELKDGYRNIVQSFGDQIKKQRPIRTTDMERYLLLIDDLPGATAKGLVRPSTKQGAADLVINLTHKTYEASYTFDNRGSKFVGPFQHTATLAANSLFGMYDRTIVRAVTTSPTKELRFIDLQHEEQIGNEGTRVTVTGSYSHSEPGDSLKVLDVRSDAVFFQAKVLHPFERSRQENLVGRAMFDVRNTSTDVFSTVDLNEDRLRVFRVGGSYDFADALLGVNLFDAEISQGLDIFNATDKGTDRSRSDGSADFTKINADISRTQSLPGSFSLYGSTSAQYSFDKLLAAEQFSIGGPVFGSGYDPAELSGDHGVAGKVELRFGQALTDPLMDSYQVYGFYHIGRVWTRDAGAGGNDKQSLASAGAGVRTNFSENLSGNLEWGVPLTKPANNQGGHAHSPRLFFSVTGRF